MSKAIILAEEMILAARAKIRGVVRSERRSERAGWASELGKLKVVVLRLCCAKIPSGSHLTEMLALVCSVSLRSKT